MQNQPDRPSDQPVPKEQTQPSLPPPGQQPQAKGEQPRRQQRNRQQRRWQHDRPFQQQKRLELSVVIPFYNEELSLRELYDGLRRALNFTGGRYEILFIDDGSTDGANRVLRDLRGRDGRVKVIRFRRNYGKSAALSVGFQHARGEYIVTMDADLQDDPTEIPRLISEIKKGYDLVSGWKRKRFDPVTKIIPSRFFNFVTRVLTGIRLHDFNCGLKAYRKEVVKEIKVYGELHRYIPVLAHWQGFSIAEIAVQHHRRKYGKSKFGLGRFWKGFLDLLTTLFTTRYSRRPLHLFGLWGMAFVIAGIVIDTWLVVEWFQGTTALSNRPLFIVGILFIIVGMQFVSIGLLGDMITKTGQPPEQEYSIREILE